MITARHRSSLGRHSAGQITDKRKRRVATDLTAVDLQVFQHSLNIIAGLVDRDVLYPVDHVYVAAARIAVIMEPLPHPSGTRVVGSDRQRIGAPEIIDQ